MFGVSLFAPFGSGGVARPVSLPDIPQLAERRADHIEKRIDSGKLDPEALDKRLQAHFGDAAKGIVGEDGSVDFDRLEKLIIETRSEKLQDRLSARFGEKAEGIVSPEGVVDKERLRELFSEQRIEHIFDRLKEKFGDRVDGVIGEDGKIDFAALKKLIAELRQSLPPEPPGAEPPGTKPPFVPGTPPAPELPRPLERASLATEEIRIDDITRPRPTGPAPDKPGRSVAGVDPAAPSNRPVIRASDQLAELRGTLLEARLERQFGRDAQDVFGDDGKIDSDALRKLFDENGPGHSPGRRGPKHSPYPGQPIHPRPFLELRA